MINTCPHCEEKFNNWVLYNEHLAFSHWKTQSVSQSPFVEDKPLESTVAFARTYSSGRTDLTKHEWRGYMPRAEKERIVQAWEAKQKEGAFVS